MRFNRHALLLFAGFCTLVAVAASSNGGNWFHAAEAVSTAIILAGLVGLGRRSNPGAPASPRRRQG
jgi:hypothetical protein